MAPDGVNVTGVLVNGQFPGPLIEANWGDTIQVKVTNNIADEPAAIHWHGFLQKGSQDMDGVPGVSQCPIAPGGSWTYTFRAELYGTGWWHSHAGSQYASGLFGPMVIYGPKNVDYDIDLGPVIISDYYHTYWHNLLSDLSQPLPNARYPFSNNILINGKNNYPCDQTDLPCVENAGEATFNFTSGKTHRLRLINPSADATLKFSIDEHTMKVIANDFVELNPYETNVVTLAPSQRSDVLVQGKDSSDGAYYMRVHPAEGCANTDGISAYAQAAIWYEDADRSAKITSTAQIGWDNDYCGNDALSNTVPYMSMDPGDPSTTETIQMAVYSNGSHGLWHLNNVSNVIDYNDPILLEAKSGSVDFEPQQAVYNFGTNSSVRIILENPTGIAHPFHLHGHNIFILAEGVGVWDGSIVNPSNPTRRDVQLVQAAGYAVVQWNQDNPGAWPLHCHIAWHLSLGMAIQVLENPDAIKNDVNIGESDKQLCRDWWSYSDSNVVNQIDSGI